MGRHFFYVVPDDAQGRLYDGGALIAQHASLEAAIAAGVAMALTAVDHGEPAEVLVQESDGRYRLEWTPGRGDGPYPC